MVSAETIPYQRETIFDKYRALSKTKHNPLWLGWDDAQIEKAQIEMCWRDDIHGPALAAVACSLVAEQLSTGNPVRYSRRKDWYAYFARHIGDPLMSYRKIVPAMDALMADRWANGTLGAPFSGRGRGKQSIAWATPALVERLAPLLVLEHRRTPEPGDVIVLRDNDKREVPVPDTEDTRRMRNDLDTLNAAYRSHQWALRGRDIEIPPLRRIFNGTMARGGRGYHQGLSYQQLSGEEREQITIDINGMQWKTVEVDYPTLHIRMAYAEAGVTMPPGDAYDVPGFDRGREVKPALNTLLNAATEKEALGVIGGQLLGDNWNRGRDLIGALKAKHPALVASFGSDAGARFQRMDSDMAIRVALAVLARTGRPPLIVHDSFIVAVCDQDALVREMYLALCSSLSCPASSLVPKASIRSFRDLLNVLPPSPSSTWGTTPSDQVEARAIEEAVRSHRRPENDPPDPEITDLRRYMELHHS